MLPPWADTFREDLLDWGKGNTRSFPWRDPDASFYEVFVAELFLTQTPAENVATVFPLFIDQYPDLEAVATADVADLAATIEPLGFQNMRAEALSAIASNYMRIPRTRDGLLELERVGPYVADATLCFALSEPQPIVDRNVNRVYDRAFGPKWPDTQTEQRAFAEAILPTEGETARRYNMALLDFGAIVCAPGTPSCDECFAPPYCDYFTTVRNSEPSKPDEE